MEAVTQVDFPSQLSRLPISGVSFDRLKIKEGSKLGKGWSAGFFSHLSQMGDMNELPIGMLSPHRG